MLRELRAQAPVTPIADLLADIVADLNAGEAGPWSDPTAAQLWDAEQSLRRAAVKLGEGWSDPHPDDCQGGCLGTGEVNGDPQRPGALHRERPGTGAGAGEAGRRRPLGFCRRGPSLDHRRTAVLDPARSSATPARTQVLAGVVVLGPRTAGSGLAS
ncbi:hypothetical protein GXW82_43805 [Streptacidiphilus sp. 4-A2]|nr:hypothetical protein [Streptacidiphilus sp. 4-A2]